MSSGRGTDPGEPEAMHFAVTESLLGLGIIPQVHLGANLTMIETIVASPSNTSKPQRGMRCS
jgi:hypothetical protein